MNWMEIALLLMGVGAFTAGFLIPDKKGDKDEVDPEVVHALIEKEMEQAKSRVSDVVDETLEYAVEKTERATERLSNEKIMAINDYSDTVLADINKAHQEVMFLYDMLNDKHNNLKETAMKVDQQAKKAEEKANAAAAKIAAKEEASIIFEKKIETLTPLANVAKKPESHEKVVETLTNITEEPVIAPVSEEKISVDMIKTIVGDQVPAVEQLIVAKPSVVEQDATQNIVKKEDTSKNVEVYSFAEQAPHIERPVAKQLQVENMENAVTKLREKQQEIEKVKKPAPVKENNNDKILRLHQLGMSSVDIAKELNLGVGEVKLVINLFKGAV